MFSWLDSSVLDHATQWLRAELERIPQNWLVCGVAVLVLLFVIGLVRKIAWLAVMIVLFGLIVGGLWVYSGQRLPGL